ncbi:MAG: hypothetical protein COB81_02255 [Flavobacteriaceae bacterium]|nr:MAG: hypothetical protein COB81_02255 [Flavobacteriaceae bacterium]
MTISKLTRSILILGILLTINQSYSQELISGKIIDITGKQITFASIIEDNTSFGTTTNEKGEFTLNINKYPTKVTISSPNHTQKTITLNRKRRITVVLREETRKVTSTD